MKPLQIFIGFDRETSITYQVLSHSIMRRSSRSVSITPLYLPQLRAMGCYTRERGPTEATEFSLTRFLTPWLSGFDGVSIFMDSDMLCLGDVAELEQIAHADPYKDVFVVKHDYTPQPGAKFLGRPQAVYPCKNWSSVMVFNPHRSAVRTLRPEYINAANPSDLHQFKWAQAIGELPAAWNHLVGEYMPSPEAKLVHFTLGGPYFPETLGCEYTNEWFAEAANTCVAGNFNFLYNDLKYFQPIQNIPGESYAATPKADAQAATVATRASEK